MRPSDTGPLLKSVWVALYGAHPRAVFATSHFSVFRSSPVARGRLNPPAEMPGPAHKQKIVRAFFQKRAIELQTAVNTSFLAQSGNQAHFPTAGIAVTSMTSAAISARPCKNGGGRPLTMIGRTLQIQGCKVTRLRADALGHQRIRDL